MEVLILIGKILIPILILGIVCAIVMLILSNIFLSRIVSTAVTIYAMILAKEIRRGSELSMDQFIVITLVSALALFICLAPFLSGSFMVTGVKITQFEFGFLMEPIVWSGMGMAAAVSLFSCGIVNLFGFTGNLTFVSVMPYLTLAANIISAIVMIIILVVSFKD